MKDAVKRYPPLRPVHLPAEYKKADVAAVQALLTGTATEQQQKRALDWIINQACDAYGPGWHPAGPHEASFAAGRRFAGLQIVKMLHINFATLTE